MPELTWEDFTPGRTFEHGPRRLPREEMIAFAAEFDPQPMHLDEAAARDTMLGGLSAIASAVQMMAVSAGVGVFMLIGALLGVTIGILFARIVAEFVLIVFRINEHLGAIRSRGDL